MTRPARVVLALAAAIVIAFLAWAFAIITIVERCERVIDALEPTYEEMQEVRR